MSVGAVLLLFKVFLEMGVSSCQLGLGVLGCVWFNRLLRLEYMDLLSFYRLLECST